MDRSLARPHEGVHVIEEAQVQPRHDLEHQVLGLPARRMRRTVRLMEPAPGLEHTAPEGNLGPDLRVRVEFAARHPTIVAGMATIDVASMKKGELGASELVWSPSLCTEEGIRTLTPFGSGF